ARAAPAAHAAAPPAHPPKNAPTATEPAVAPADADPLAVEAAALAVAPASVPDVAADDPRVREWVKRFVGNQGPPRVGSAFHSLLPEGGGEPPVEREITVDMVPSP